MEIPEDRNKEKKEKKNQRVGEKGVFDLPWKALRHKHIPGKSSIPVSARQRREEERSQPGSRFRVSRSKTGRDMGQGMGNCADHGEMLRSICYSEKFPGK